MLGVRMHPRFIADPVIQFLKSRDIRASGRGKARNTTPSASQASYCTNDEASNMTQDTEVSDKGLWSHALVDEVGLALVAGALV